MNVEITSEVYQLPRIRERGKASAKEGEVGKPRERWGGGREQAGKLQLFSFALTHGNLCTHT